VESNDTLYGGSAEYMEEMRTITDRLLEEVLDAIAQLNEDTDKSVHIISSLSVHILLPFRPFIFSLVFSRPHYLAL
jgi:hypothetical protein